jgi:TP901 family phage tail tape measure protein
VADTVLERLVVILGADFSELDGALAQLGSKVSSRIERASSSITRAGGIITAAITVPITGMGIESIKAAADFESSFATVRKSVEATEPEFSRLKQGIRDMAKEMPASAAEIAKVAGEAGQLGIASKDLLTFTETAIKLGTVTNMSAEEAGKGLARLSNIMQLPASGAGHLADELVHLGNKGASTESEIMNMSLRIAGAGKIIGLSVDEVMAWANAASSVGLRAEQGGSAISRTFIQVANAVRGIEPAKEDLEKIADHTEKVAVAAHDLEMAQRGVRDAQEAVTASSRSVRDAHEGVAQAGRNLRDAQEAVVQSGRNLRDANDSVVTASRGVRDANEQVSSAHRAARNATEALSDAYKNLARAQRDQRQASLDARRETLSVAEAQQSLTELRAQEGQHTLDVKDAQLALTQARKDATEAAKKGGLDSQAAALRVEQAQMRLNQVMTQGPKYALDMANAQLRLEEAQNRVGSAAEKNADNAQKLNRNVRDATEAVTDASKGERNASEAVGIANKNLQKSYESVQDAQKNQRNAIEGVSDAQKGQRNANEAVSDANRALRNSTEGVGDAQYNVQQQTKKYNVSQRELGDITEKVYGKLDTFAKTAGMSSQAFADLFKADPSKALLKVLQGLDQMDKSGGDVLGTLDKLGITEVRQRDAVLRLAGANDVLKQSLEDATQASGEADRVYQERTATFAAQWEIFKNKITDVFITIGTALLPIIINVMDAMKPFIDMFAFAARVFANMPKPIQMIAVALLLLLAAIGPLLVALGMMIPGIYALVVFLPIIGPMLIALLGPIGLIVLAIAAFGLALYMLQKHGDEMKDAITGSFGFVLDYLKNNWKDLVFDFVAGPFIALAVKAANAFGVTDALKSAFSSAIAWIKQAILDLVAFVVSKFNDLKQKANDIKGFLDPRNLPHTITHAGQGLIPSFDVGSAYVPNDMMAFVHKGEAIIPASQNPYTNGVRTLGGGGGSGTTVALSGPVTVNNIGSTQDAKGALNTLGFGISNALARRGI